MYLLKDIKNNKNYVYTNESINDCLNYLKEQTNLNLQLQKINEQNYNIYNVIEKQGYIWNSKNIKDIQYTVSYIESMPILKTKSQTPIDKCDECESYSYSDLEFLIDYNNYLSQRRKMESEMGNEIESELDDQDFSLKSKNEERDKKFKQLEELYENDFENLKSNPYSEWFPEVEYYNNYYNRLNSNDSSEYDNDNDNDNDDISEKSSLNFLNLGSFCVKDVDNSYSDSDAYSDSDSLQSSSILLNTSFNKELKLRLSVPNFGLKSNSKRKLE